MSPADNVERMMRPKFISYVTVNSMVKFLQLKEIILMEDC
jgi:hypothetical protein